MTTSHRHNALKAYGAVGAHSQTVEADGYKLVQLMYANVLERIAAIKGHLQRGEVVRKCEQVDKINQIIAELVDSLDLAKGGVVAENLKRVYEYCLVRLLKAHVENDEVGFEEIAAQFRKLKSAWDQIDPAARVAVGQ